MQRVFKISISLNWKHEYIWLLSKCVGERWQDIGQVLFLHIHFMDRDEVKVHKHTKRKKNSPPSGPNSGNNNNKFVGKLWKTRAGKIGP